MFVKLLQKSQSKKCKFRSTKYCEISRSLWGCIATAAQHQERKTFTFSWYFATPWISRNENPLNPASYGSQDYMGNLPDLVPRNVTKPHQASQNYPSIKVVITLKFIAQKKSMTTMFADSDPHPQEKVHQSSALAKILIWKILPEQWLGVDRGTASR